MKQIVCDFCGGVIDQKLNQIGWEKILVSRQTALGETAFDMCGQCYTILLEMKDNMTFHTVGPT